MTLAPVKDNETPKVTKRQQKAEKCEVHRYQISSALPQPLSHCHFDGTRKI